MTRCICIILIDISSPFPANEAKYAVSATSTVNVLKLHFKDALDLKITLDYYSVILRIQNIKK